MTSEPRPKKWRRRFVRTAIVLLVLALVVRIAVPLALPSALASWAESNDLVAKYDELDLSVLTGDLELWHLSLSAPDSEGDEREALHVEFAALHLDFSSLFTGRPRIGRVEIDGLDLFVEREADGTFSSPLARGGAGSPSREPREPLKTREPEAGSDPDPDAESPTPLDLELPFELAALRVQEVRVDLLDRTVSPALHRRFEAGLRVSDVGSRSRRARIELRASAPGTLDALHLSASVGGSSEELDARLSVELAGLHPEELESFLTPSGITPVADTLAFGLDGILRVRAGTPRAPATRVSLELSNVALSADDVPAFTIAEVTATALLGGPVIEVPEIALRGIRGDAVRLADGALAAAGLELRPVATTETEPDPPDPPELAETASGDPPAFALRAFVLDDVALHLRDESVTPAVELEALVSDFDLTDLVFDPAAPGRKAALAARLAVPGLVDTIYVAGELVPFGPERAAALEVTLDDVHLERAEPYLSAAGLAQVPEVGRLKLTVNAALPGDAAGSADLGIHLARLGFTDETVDPPVALALQDVALDVADLPLGAVDEPGTATIAARMRSEGLFDIVELSGTVASAPGDLDLRLELALEGRGLSTVAVAQYLDAAGVESSLRNGALALALDAHVRSTDAGLELDLALRDVALRARGQEAEPDVALDAVRIAGVVIADDSISIGEVAIEGPIARAARDAEGALLFAGLRVPAFAAAAAEPASAATPPTPPTAPPAPTVDVDETETAPPPSVAIDAVHLRGLRLQWADHGVSPAVDTALTVAATVGSIRIGDGAPAMFEVTLAAGDALDELTLDGTVSIAPDDVALEARLRARGLERGELGGYLPPGVGVTLVDGRVDATLSAGIEPAVEGGLRAWLDLSDLVYADGETELVALESATVRAARFDPEGGRIAVDEVVVSGLELAARKTGETRIEVAGLSIETPPETAEAPVDVEAPAAQPRPSAPGSPTEGRVDVEALPLVTLTTLDVGIDRFRYVDETQDAEPLDLALHLRNAEPLVLLDAQPAELPPIALTVTATATPFVERLVVELAAQPFLDQPELEAALSVSGIRGEGLTELLPSLSETLDGRELDGGRFDAQLSGQLKWRRRSPIDFDVTSGFGAELTIENVAFRARPDGDVLLGLDSLVADVGNINPVTGDVHVRSLEIATPRLSMTKDAQGLHVLGLVLKPAPPEEPSDDAAGAGDEDAVALVEAAVPTEAAGPPGPELRLDSLVVEGLAVDFLDTSVAPAMHVPLDELDVEVQGFTTRLFDEERALRYWIHLGAGDVDLPKRSKRSLLGGLARTALDATGLKGGEVARVPRPLFDELGITGRVSLHPAPKGWTKIELGALELPGLAGPAAAGGVTIGDGVLDASIDVRMFGEDGISTKSTFSFQHLSLDEPADGPISRYLKLPAPLDAVLFVLKNDDGEHVIPLNFDLKAGGGIGGGEIAQAATTTLVKVIGDAIASSPFRVVGSVTNMVGLTNDDPEDLSEDSVSVSFAAADPALAPDRVKALESVVDLLDDDELTVVLRHELGTTDLVRADILASPSPEDCRDLARRLRAKKVELASTRHELAAETRAHYAVGRDAEALSGTERLRAIDRELGLTEDALDRLYDLLHPGAERRRGKRTRAACLDIATRRLEAVRAALVNAGIAPDRIDVRRPRFEVGERADGAIHVVPKRRP